MSATRQADRHGNVRATEGVDRCPCGAKYWENDRCHSCGEPFRPHTHPTGFGLGASVEECERPGCTVDPDEALGWWNAGPNGSCPACTDGTCLGRHP